MSHTLKETIELAVKNTILRMHPIGKLWLTFGDENPADIVGGWEKIDTYVLQCSSDQHKAGETIEAGLPNITGDTRSVEWSTSDSDVLNYETLLNNSGPYERHLTVNNGEHIVPIWSQEKGLRRVGVNFNASRSNPIYGRSDTVQPNTIIINVWKRVS